MFENEEGLGRLSVYTDMWINRVFPDFYNLAMHAISPKMNKIQNKGFQKLLKHEMDTRDEDNIKTIKYYNQLSLQISDSIDNYLKECSNEEIKIFNTFKKIHSIVEKTLALKMFEYGVQFGMELKNETAENFKW